MNKKQRTIQTYGGIRTKLWIKGFYDLLMTFVLCSLFASTGTAQSVAEWQQKTIKEFPDIAVKGSPLNTLYVSEYQHLKGMNSALLLDPKWPFRLAQMCDSKLHLSGETTQPAPPSATPQSQPDVPSLDATSNNYGTSHNKSTDAAGWTQKQDIHSLGVFVKLQSFHPPKAAYEVQCFFVARNESDKLDYVYAAQHQSSSLQTDTLTFQAPLLEGDVSRFLSIPLVGTTSKGDSVSLSLDYSQKIIGSTFHGWIVRVISQGKVVRIASNQNSLETLAKENPRALDTAAKHTEQ